ncbi:hypothetical protein ACVIHA_004248, partial [Bradyrhizobium liaoningense]
SYRYRTNEPNGQKWATSKTQQAIGAVAKPV